MDTGPVYAWRATPIAPDEDAGALSGRLAALGARLLVETLPGIASGAAAAAAQDDARATLCPKIRREDGRVDWDAPGRGARPACPCVLSVAWTLLLPRRDAAEAGDAIRGPGSEGASRGMSSPRATRSSSPAARGRWPSASSRPRGESSAGRRLHAASASSQAKGSRELGAGGRARRPRPGRGGPRARGAADRRAREAASAPRGVIPAGPRPDGPAQRDAPRPRPRALLTDLSTSSTSGCARPSGSGAAQLLLMDRIPAHAAVGETVEAAKEIAPRAAGLVERRPAEGGGAGGAPRAGRPPGRGRPPRADLGSRHRTRPGSYAAGWPSWARRPRAPRSWPTTPTPRSTSSSTRSTSPEDDLGRLGAAGLTLEMVPAWAPLADR